MKKFCWALQIKGTVKFVARLPMYHWEACTTVLFRTRKQAEEWLTAHDRGYWQKKAMPIKVKVQIEEAFAPARRIKNEK